MPWVPTKFRVWSTFHSKRFQKVKKQVSCQRHHKTKTVEEFTWSLQNAAAYTRVQKISCAHTVEFVQDDRTTRRQTSKPFFRSIGTSVGYPSLELIPNFDVSHRSPGVMRHCIIYGSSIRNESWSDSLVTLHANLTMHWSCPQNTPRPPDTPKTRGLTWLREVSQKQNSNWRKEVSKEHRRKLPWCMTPPTRSEVTLHSVQKLVVWQHFSGGMRHGRGAPVSPGRCPAKWVAPWTTL
jgi:hypothetical protein